MKIGRRGLFGLGAVAVVAAPAVALAAKADAPAVEAFDDALDADLADFARQYKAEFIAAFEERDSLIRKTVTTEFPVSIFPGGQTWTVYDWKE
jgi:hypothetical protein